MIIIYNNIEDDDDGNDGENDCVGCGGHVDLWVDFIAVIGERGNSAQCS